MKKSILASSILASVAVSVSQAAFAYNANIDERILITANRSQQDSFLALSSNSVITRDDIEAMQVASVSDILKTVAGIHVVSQGDAGQNSSVFTRGMESDHTLILLDGVRVNSATLGTTNFAALSAQQIERIEIVKGPRAALWGSDALAGVIQIFTKRYANNEGAINLGVGSNSFYQSAVSVGFGNEQHQYTLTASSEQSDGFNAYQSDPDNPYDLNEPDNDGYQRQTISLIGDSQFSKAFGMSVVARFQRGESEFDASYPDQPCWDDFTKVCPSFYANEQDTKTYHTKVAGHYQFGKGSMELALAKSQDRGEQYGNGVDLQQIQTKRDQVSFVLSYPFTEQSSVTTGTEWYQEKVSANYDLDIYTPETQTFANTSRDVSAIFAQARHQIDRVLLEVAVRGDDIEQVGNETTYNLSLGYQLAKNWLVSANTGTGFKAPSFNDLYWPGSGNAELKPETSKTNELLVRHFEDNYNVELSLYDTEVDNLISWAEGADGLWRPANVDRATMTGVDLAASLDFGNLSHQFNFGYVETEDKKTKEELLRRPKVSADYTLGYQWNAWHFSSTLSYRDEARDTAELDSYWLLDVGAQWQVNDSLLLSAKVNNLFDEAYETSRNYVADGRNFTVNASFAF
ncbi:TonB-dependent receptor domain-containing protein [Thalassotalea fusca]